MKKRRLYHGTAYYPEVWLRADSGERENYKKLMQDIYEMKRLGINLVRMGEFAWSSFEAEPDHFDFKLFQFTIKTLYANGIDTVMCTPTAAPPIWLTETHPDCRHLDLEGRMNHGSRLHVCINNRYYRERAARITEKMAQILGKMPGVVMWQLDNEIKSQVSYCICSECKVRWQEWLEKRYGSIERLNEVWGTNIFSERYFSFSQVPQPVKTPFLHNASLSTLYRRFSMDMASEFVEEQAKILKRFGEQPITTNGNLGFDVDNAQLYSRLDCCGFDTYASSRHYYIYLMNHDYWRSVKSSGKHWLLETSCSHSGHIQSSPIPHPTDYLTVEAVAAYALDSQSFCYWLFKQQKTGCEINHSAILSAWGKPTVGYREVLKVNAAKKRIEEIVLNTELAHADIALFYSDQARTFFETEKLEGNNYLGIIRELYRQILDMGFSRAVISEKSSIDGYKLVWTPFLPNISEQLINRLLEFTENGGCWITGPMTGHRTEDHNVPVNCALGRLEQMLNIETKFLYPMTGTGAVGNAFGVKSELGGLGAVFQKQTEEHIVGIVEGGLTPGEPFIIEKKIGRGKVILMGAYPVGENGGSMVKEIVRHYAGQLEIRNIFHATAGTVVIRRYGKITYYFIINMNGEGGRILLESDYLDVLTQEILPAGAIDIRRYEYRVIRENKNGGGEECNCTI